MTARATAGGAAAAGGARLLGIGVYRPERLVTNAEIAGRIGVSPEWIEARSGFRTRRFADSGETIENMAVTASAKALSDAGLSAADIDVVILATFTYLWQLPAAAPIVAHQLGTNGAAAFDLSAACAGFCYGLAVARDFILGGSARHVLVAGVERMSDVVDPHDRDTAFLFADGAGTAIVGPSPEPEIGPVVWGTNGAHSSALTMTRSWATTADPGQEPPYVTMDGRRLFRWIRAEVAPAANRALEAAGVTWNEVRAFIPHQANARIIDVLVDLMHVPSSVVVADDGTRAGNTSAASIPLAMHALIESGKVTRGDAALLIGFGAGATYAAQVVRVP